MKMRQHKLKSVNDESESLGVEEKIVVEQPQFDTMKVTTNLVMKSGGRILMGVYPATEYRSQSADNSLRAFLPAVQRAHAGGRLEIEHHGVLAAIELVERQRFPVHERLRVVTHVVATVGLLDLDDRRAEIRQDRRRIRRAQSSTACRSRSRSCCPCLARGHHRS